MRTLVLTLAALAALAPLATASSPYWATGNFTTGAALADGTPAAAQADACLAPSMQGKTSDCAFLPTSARGATYTLSASGEVPVLGLTACFYDGAKTLLRCDQFGVPPAVQADVGAIKVDPKAAPAILENSLGSETIVGIVPLTASTVSITALSGVQVSWVLQTS
jgi:hypothetical protein